MGLGWEVIPVLRRGEEVAKIFRAGTEVHLCPVKELGTLWLNRSFIREYVKPMFDDLGFLTTRTEIDDPVHQGWVEKFGFKKTWADERFQYYHLERLPFTR